MICILYVFSILHKVTNFCFGRKLQKKKTEFEEREKGSDKDEDEDKGR